MGDGGEVQGRVMLDISLMPACGLVLGAMGLSANSKLSVVLLSIKT